VAIEPHRALPPSELDQGPIPWEEFATRVARRHGVVLAGVGLIAAQLVWKAAVLGHFFFWQDDFVFFDRSLDNNLTWQLLMKPEGGHLDPGPYAFSWVLARISLYNWALVSVVLLLLLAGACLALLRLLRTLFGTRSAILIPLTIYLLCPLTVPVLVWWSTAIESVPLQLAMFMAADAHIRYLRGGRPRHAVIAAAWLSGGLLFSEKGMILVPLLFALTCAYFVDGRWPRSCLQALTRYWRVWLLYVSILAGYAVVLVIQLTAPGGAPGARGAPQDVAGFAFALVKDTFVPGALGGPWQWFPQQIEAFSVPPAPLDWLALIAGAAVIAASIWFRKYAWRAWAILAGWLVLADMVPIIVGRLTFTNHSFLAFLGLDTHYVADAVGVLAICVGLAFWPVAGRPDMRRVRRAQVVSGQAVPVATGLVFGMVLLGSVWSVQSYVNVTSSAPGRAYLANARQALAAVPRGTPVVDQYASSDVVAAILLARYGYEDEVLGHMAPGRIRWTRQPDGTIPDLKVFGPDGRLWPAAVVGVASQLIPKDMGCWPVRGQSIRVPLDSVARVTNGPWTLRMSYVSSTAQQVLVYFGGRWAPLALDKGLDTAYLPVQGSGDEVIVATPGSTGMLCVGNVAVGVLLQDLSGSPIPAVAASG
jgi:hypothetical protein